MALEDAKKHNDMAFTRQEFRGLSNELTFAGATSFYRCRYSKDLKDVDLAISGVPFDCGVTNRSGCRLGPRAVREASTLQAGDPPYGWDFNPFEEFSIADYGDMAFDYARTQDFPETLRTHIRGILAAGASPITIGGDHYVTYPILQAMAEKYGPLSLLQFDAHTDTWQDDDRERIDHGTMFYKAIKEGIIVPERSVQVGIRTLNEDQMGVNVLDARSVHLNGPLATVAKVKEIIGDNPTYLTFDIDALDPAFAPGTGTPVWGGLTSAQASIMLQELAGINLVGGDLVEVSPAYDTSGATAVAGAHVVTELICLWAANQRNKR